MERTCLNFIIFGVLIVLPQVAWCQNSSIIKRGLTIAKLKIYRFVILSGNCVKCQFSNFAKKIEGLVIFYICPLKLLLVHLRTRTPNVGHSGHGCVYPSMHLVREMYPSIYLGGGVCIPACRCPDTNPTPADTSAPRDGH